MLLEKSDGAGRGPTSNVDSIIVYLDTDIKHSYTQFTVTL